MPRSISRPGIDSVLWYGTYATHDAIVSEYRIWAVLNAKGQGHGILAAVGTLVCWHHGVVKAATEADTLQVSAGEPAMSAIVLESELTCPNCGFTKRETMPTDACQFYYECLNCTMLLRPLPGHCCVFCSYGSVPCPPVQVAHLPGIAAGSCC